MIEAMTDLKVDLEEQNKIVIATLCCKVSTELGSKTCIETLTRLSEGE